MSSTIASFPENYSPRVIQKDILKEIDEKLASGYKKIILSAPTGVGKSLIAACVARHFESSFIVTASKHLQDQYSKDLDFLKPIKGKSNFPCLKLMKEKMVRSTSRASRLGLTCEKGRCIEKVSKNGKTIEEVCSFKPKIKQVKEGKQDIDSCLYYMQKYQALVSPHSLWNYSAYFQIMKYNQKLFADYLNRRIAIFDEAHKIEDQIIQFIGVDIYKGAVQECGLELESYDLSDINSIITLADSIAQYYANRLRELENSKSFAQNPDFELVSRLESRFKRASQARIEMLEDTENFVINKPATEANGDFKSVSIKPIDISKYVKEFFQAPYQMFMSATIDKQSFCENTGIDPDQIAIIDTPKSPFPLENRKVDFLDIRRLNNRSTEQDKLAVIQKIDEIMTQHSQHRGLILTSSIYWCNQIQRNLSQTNARRIKICHSKNADGKTQDEVLGEHANTANSVLLSSSLWEGVDLKDDLARFQIIAKVPYLNLSEQRVSQKMRLFPLWYDAQTLVRLLQGFGRSIRNDTDWAHTYVLDSSVHNVLEKAKHRIPKAYHDTLGWS